MRLLGPVHETAAVCLLLCACHTTGTSSASSSQSSSGSGGAPSTCRAASAEGIELTNIGAIDPAQSLGYPPYAVDGCDLLYVAATGELRLRDLGNGSERVVSGAAATPSRPAISGTTAAWEASENGKRVVRVLDLSRRTAAPVTISGPFDHAGEPRVSASSVVFTAWLATPDTSDTDVYVFDLASGQVSPIATGPGQQRFADVSSAYFAWSDFSVGPSGIFADQMGDAANIVVRDRATGSIYARTKPGKQAFPMLGIAGKIAYLDWGLVHPEPKFSEYDLKLGDVGAGMTDALVAHIQTNVYLRPVAEGESLEWIATSPMTAAPTLMRSGVDLSVAPVTVSAFDGETVIGPSSGRSMTLIGTMAPNMPALLRAFAR